MTSCSQNRHATELRYTLVKKKMMYHIEKHTLVAKKARGFFLSKGQTPCGFVIPFFQPTFQGCSSFSPPPYLTISVYVINLPEAALPPHFPGQIRDSFWNSFQFLFLQWYRTLVSRSVKAILGLHDSVLIWHL